MFRPRPLLLPAALLPAALHLVTACRTVEPAPAPPPEPPAAPELPDRDLLFVSDRDGNDEIYLLRPGSEEWIDLSNDEAPDSWPEWSPDGSRIAFQSQRSGNLDIWVMNADGSDPVQLTHGLEHDYLPSWSPDGNQIGFMSFRVESGDTAQARHIYVMNADGTDQHRLFPEATGTSTAVDWSDDGKTFVVGQRTGAGGADIFLLDREGGILRRLTDDPAHAGAPAFSPDGKEIAYYVDDGSVSRLVLASVDGTRRRVLVDEGKNWDPRWSPDGNWLLFTREKPGTRGDRDVMAVRVEDGAEPVLLIGGPGAQGEARWRP
jgi:TolB protein